MNSIIDSAIAEGIATPEAVTQPEVVVVDEPEALPDADKPVEPEKPEEPWPKKAENALAKAKGKAAQLRAERDQERAARQRAEQQLAQYTAPKPDAKPTGEPQEKDFANYHDYIRALNKFDSEQLLVARDGKQKETIQTANDQAWVAQREARADEQMESFAKEMPDAQQLYNENADVVKSFSPEIKRAFLAADNVPLALYNLAKEGKLDDLADMSLEDVKVEIRLAQLKQPEKPRTKAPAPLPASRGSVAGSKSLTDMDASELIDWVHSPT